MDFTQIVQIAACSGECLLGGCTRHVLLDDADALEANFLDGVAQRTKVDDAVAQIAHDIAVECGIGIQILLAHSAENVKIYVLKVQICHLVGILLHKVDGRGLAALAVAVDVSVVMRRSQRQEHRCSDKNVPAAHS